MKKLLALILSLALLTGALSRWLVKPELYTLTTTYPEAGLKEKHDAELEAKLAEIKAGMSEEEKQAIIDRTNATAPEEDNSEMLASLTAVTVATLPEEVKTYELRDETWEDGVRRIEAVCGTDGVSYISLNLDAAALPQEDLHYLRLFTRLLGHMDTDQHSWEELEKLTGAISAINRRINGAPDDITLQAMRTLKTATPETLKVFAGYLADMLNTDIRGTAGGASSINSNAGIFDAVLNPFNAEDLSQVGIPDVSEDHEHYEAIRFAVDNGYMALREDGTFGPDDPATVGDFLGGLYPLIGGGAADAEA